MFPAGSLRLKASGTAGFSVVEVVIAAAIFLFIAIGMLPLFTRSINSNLIGNDYMNAANHGRTELETMQQREFDSPDLTLDAGATTKEVKEYWTQGDPKKAGDEKWLTALPSTGEQILWNRTTTVREYSISALSDNNLETSEALPGGTDPGFVHLKEIRTVVESTRGGGALGGGKKITLRLVKAY